jgi:uncharacterized membrane protein/protein-disulfide isomerase
MKSRSRKLILAFAAAGLAASATSSYVHYQLLTKPGYTSFCDVSATVSCAQAYLSQYGSLFGVPVALGGMFYFAVVLLMAGLLWKPGAPAPSRAATAPVPGKAKVASAAKAAAKTPPARADAAVPSSAETAPAYIFALSTLALAAILYLAWAAFFQLNAVCLLCVVTYVAVIAIFIISGGATSVPMTALPTRAAGDARALLRSPAAIVMTVVLIGAAAASIAAFPREAPTLEAAAQGPDFPPLTDGQKAEFEKWYNVQPVVDVPIDRGGAKVLVVKFNDYMCPPCRQTYVDYKGILAKHTASGAVKYVTKHFPIEPECNPPMAGGTHHAACEAAAAVLMADKDGAASKLEDWLFAHQPELTRDKVKEGAAEVAGIKDFDTQYPKFLEQVRADAGLGATLGAKSTPTFFINGRRIAGGVPAPYFDYAIELELKRQP